MKKAKFIEMLVPKNDDRMKHVGTTRAQRNLLARDIRIVEARGSTPLYSTKQKKSELDSYRKRVRIFSLLELYTNITLNVKESV